MNETVIEIEQPIEVVVIDDDFSSEIIVISNDIIEVVEVAEQGLPVAGDIPHFVWNETPSGAVNGSNATFTLANTPVSGSEHIFLNGLLQDVGAGNDYTISGAVITLLTAPLTGEKIRVSYRK